MARPISELAPFISGFATDIVDALFETATRIKLRMAEPGQPRNPNEKVDWDNPKQQAAYFASDGFGQGIPYHRKGDFERSWGVERQPFGVSAFSLHHAAGAIGGLPSGWQSRIHRNRRPYLLQVLAEELNKLPDAIRNRFTARAK